MSERHRVWIEELRQRRQQSDSTIARDIKAGRLRAPYYAPSGYRYWWSDELHEDDARWEALGTGPRVRPPPPPARALKAKLCTKVANTAEPEVV